MKHNQKGLGVVKGLIILVTLGVLGFVTWYVWPTKDNTNNIDTTACSTTQATSNKSSQLPSGWNWYEIRDIGLKYAYPKSWDPPTTQTNSGLEKYVASFTLGSSGTNTTVSLSPDCSDFQSSLSAINNDQFDTVDDRITTKAINHNLTSYSSLSHWSSDAGNHYQLITYAVVSVGRIKLVTISYSVVTGSEVCPDNKLAPANQPKCINQSTSDEIDKVISSLQKI